MSSSIWTRCAGDSKVRPLRLSPWRVVESQHQVSTRKLVDTAAEQELLEELIERAKPVDVTHGKIHYLLSTPFRYPPLRHGSRFGSRHEQGIWYGSESLPAAFAEVAYYRFVFLEGTSADLEGLTTELTAFRVHAHSQRGIDLVGQPFDRHRRTIASPSKYTESQSLGAAMRAAGVELFRYPSARDPDRGANAAAFTPGVFGKAKPRDFETWVCHATREWVELTKRDFFARDRQAFTRDAFLVDGLLPAPAV
jgi:hypothetical protein